MLSHSLAQIMVQGSSGLHGCLFVPSSISIKSFPVTARTHAAEAMSSMQGTSAEPIIITLPKLQGQQLLPFIWLEVSEKAMGSLMLSSRARRSRHQQASAVVLQQGASKLSASEAQEGCSSSRGTKRVSAVQSG